VIPPRNSAYVPRRPHLALPDISATTPLHNAVSRRPQPRSEVAFPFRASGPSLVSPPLANITLLFHCMKRARA